MTFSRVKSAGWGLNSELTNAEMDQLDINHAGAVDKSSTDTTTGTITFGAGSSLVVAAAGGITVNGDLTITGAGAELKTASSGRITLGDNDYPELAVGHTYRNRGLWHPIRALNPYSSASWSYGASSLLGVYYYPAAINQNFICELTWVHNGATLTTVDVWFEAVTGHLGLPTLTDRPSVSVTRHGPFATSGTAPASANLSATAQQYMTMPGGIGDYNGKMQYISYTCDQNNVIDSDQYVYRVKVFDELGANAVAGNKYMFIALTYSTITDMRFP